MNGVSNYFKRPFSVIRPELRSLYATDGSLTLKSKLRVTASLLGSLVARGGGGGGEGGLHSHTTAGSQGIAFLPAISPAITLCG